MSTYIFVAIGVAASLSVDFIMRDASGLRKAAMKAVMLVLLCAAVVAAP